MCLFMILLKSHVMFDTDEAQIRRSLGHVLAECTKEEFVGCEAWFDKYECSVDRDYSIAYPRLQYVKEIIFSLFENENGKMDLTSFFRYAQSRDIVI